ncbi:hypothetical protein [Haloarchaeobius sp. DT45]
MDLRLRLSLAARMVVAVAGIAGRWLVVRHLKRRPDPPEVDYLAGW